MDGSFDVRIAFITPQLPTIKWAFAPFIYIPILVQHLLSTSITFRWFICCLFQHRDRRCQRVVKSVLWHKQRIWTTLFVPNQQNSENLENVSHFQMTRKWPGRSFENAPSYLHVSLKPRCDQFVHYQKLPTAHREGDKSWQDGNTAVQDHPKYSYYTNTVHFSV